MDDRLCQYATDAGITDTLARVSRRIATRMPKRAIQLEDAMPTLRANHAALTSDFHEFYPDLIDYANRDVTDKTLGCDTDSCDSAPRFLPMTAILGCRKHLGHEFEPN